LSPPMANCSGAMTGWSKRSPGRGEDNNCYRHSGGASEAREPARWNRIAASALLQQATRVGDAKLEGD